VSIAENDATEVAPGTRVLVLYENRELEGRVTAISPQVADSQVKGTVVFSGEAPANLRQNLRVQTRLVFESKPDVLKAPRGPFLESGGGRRAYIVQNGIASLREIETGAVSVSEVEIVKGLVAGDRIVVSDTADFQGAKTVLLR
jgi:HlyD family secretion protein